MFLVTGAAGKTGRAVLKALSRRGVRVRAWVRREEQRSLVEECGAAEVVEGDLRDGVGAKAAVEGVEAVYLIVPNLHPEETRIGEIVIEAVRDVGVERLVYHSVLHPQTRDMPHHWHKLLVEENLFECGLEYTILQPAPYMQNLLPYWQEIVETGIYRVPYGEQATLSLVDLEDVADVAAGVLIDARHRRAIYELAGPEALAPSKVAEALSRSLHRTVQSEAVPLQVWARQAAVSGLDPYSREALSAMFRYYDSYGLSGNSIVLERLLGRPPTSFDEFLDRIGESE